MKTEKENIILIGGGGHCKACIDVIEMENKFEILGILDDDTTKLGTIILGYKIIGTSNQIKDFKQSCTNFLVTIGQIKSSEIRIQIFNKIKKENVNLPVIISPTAYVSKHSELGEGTIVMHHALINANAKIKENCIINSKALIEHDSEIGAHSHISTGCIVNGTVKVGEKTFIGSNATLVNNISISEETIIASGSVVFKNINIKGTYAGNPAKKIN